MALNELNAFTPVAKLEPGTFFKSKDVDFVIRKGTDAANEHKFQVLDSPIGGGATLALNALRLAAKKDSKMIVIELGSYPRTMRTNLRGLLWKDIIIGLGEKPAWRWGDWVDKKGVTKQGRRLQLRDLLYKLYESGQKVLIILDEALSQPRHIWELLYTASRINIENKKYGPGVVIAADLSDKNAFYKPDYIVEEGKPEFPDYARRSSFKLAGLGADEVERFIQFQASRDGGTFTQDFVAEIKAKLSDEYLTSRGLHRLPSTINTVGRNVMELYHNRGHSIYTTAQKSTTKNVVAGVKG